MPFSLYLQQSVVSTAQLKQYASTAQLFDMVKWTKEAYNHFGVPYFDTCCQAEPFNLDPFMPFLISAQAGNNITVSTFDNKLWAPQVSGMVYATGTTNYIAKFQGGTSLINSTLFEYITVSGTTMIVNGTTSQKVAMQDDGITANLLLPNFTTSSPSGYSAISSQVLDGSRNRRVSQFINDTLELWGHSVIYSTGIIPTYGIWQGLNRTLSIAPTGNVIIRTSNISGDFTDTGYKLDVFGSLRTNSTVNFTGIASTTTANTLYYNSSTGAVTYGTAPSIPSNVSSVYISSSTTFTNASYITLATFNVGNASATKTYKFYYNGNINTNAGVQFKISGTAARNAIYLISTALDTNGNLITPSSIPSYSWGLTNPAYNGPTFVISVGNNIFSKIEGTVQYAAGVTGTLTVEITATGAGSPNYIQTGALIELTEI